MRPEAWVAWRGEECHDFEGEASRNRLRHGGDLSAARTGDGKASHSSVGGATDELTFDVTSMRNGRSPPSADKVKVCLASTAENSASTCLSTRWTCLVMETETRPQTRGSATSWLFNLRREPLNLLARCTVHACAA